jgi:hypothetical protein
MNNFWDNVGVSLLVKMESAEQLAAAIFSAGKYDRSKDA